MKIAFVDNLEVGGGLSRFSYLLCINLLKKDSSIFIDYYVHEGNLKRTPELLDITGNFEIHVLESTRKLLTPPLPFVKRVSIKILRKIHLYKPPLVVKKEVIKEIEERVINYDIAYFPVAHMMQKPSLSVPIVGTIHDFNWKYFFGSQIFSKDFVNKMDGEIFKWLSEAKTASSSHDVVTETKKLYPSIKKHPEVIHIAPVVFSEGLSEIECDNILRKLEVDFPYVIFPGNFFPHKNHLNLFSAFALLKQRSGFEKYKLILTGLNTDQISYGIAEKFGVQVVTENSFSKDFDVRGLGYQSNTIVEALIKKATLLVSPSIYEAICTPGMDAWYFGTPTAISNIAPFKEHQEILGIRSAFFDPMDVKNIADTMESYINDYAKALENAKISQENILKYNWEAVATKYLDMFKKSIDEFKQ